MKALRIVIAALLAVGSFALMRQWYDGACVLPIYDDGREVLYMFWFLILPTLCLGGVLWFVAELSYTLLQKLGVADRLVPYSLLAAFLVYAAIGFGVWQISPPFPQHVDPNDEMAYPIVFGVWWPVSILAEMDTFSRNDCGA